MDQFESILIAQVAFWEEEHKEHQLEMQQIRAEFPPELIEQMDEDGDVFGELVTKALIDSRSNLELFRRLRDGKPFGAATEIRKIQKAIENSKASKKAKERPHTSSLMADRIQGDQPVDFSMYSDEGLDMLLSEAIDVEDYEKAAKIRDEIAKR